MKKQLSLISLALLFSLSTINTQLQAQSIDTARLAAVEQQIQSLQPALLADYQQLTNTADSEARQAKARSMTQKTGQLVTELDAIYKAHFDNSTDYSTNLALYAAFIESNPGLSSFYLVQALDAQSKGFNFRFSPYYSHLKEAHRLAERLERSKRAKQQARLIRQLGQEIEQLGSV